MKAIGKKTWILLGLFMLGIVVLDQASKALVVKYIPEFGRVRLIPGVVHLTYCRNTGAAFSMLSGMRWLFLVLVLVFFAAVWYLIRRGILNRPAELWCLAAVGGGALGNAADRVLTGEVTDMIEVEFMSFAVFNVADCFITCGAVALAIVLLFFDRHDEKVNSEE